MRQWLQAADQGLAQRWRGASTAIGKREWALAQQRLRALKGAKASLGKKARRWLQRVPEARRLWRRLEAQRSAVDAAAFGAHKGRLQKLLSPEPMPALWTSRLRALELHVQRAQRLRDLATKAYRKSRWRKAYKGYQRYLRAYPKAADARRMRRRLKACRCVFGPLPWESCQRADFPRHYKRK